MASQVSGIIEKIHVSGQSGTSHSIASTAYGYCETPAATSAKTVDMTGFILDPGVTIHVKFQYENTAESPTLNVQGTGAKPIIYGIHSSDTNGNIYGWNADATLTLTYDGTNWVSSNSAYATSAGSATTASKLTTSNLGSNIKPIYLVAGVATECKTYAGGTKVTLNASDKSEDDASFYAPISSGDAGNVLISTGSSAPNWYTGLSLTGSGTENDPYSATFSNSVTVNNKLYIGGDTSYGDAYTPIYWNDGIPTAVTPIQKVAFTINSGKSGVQLSNTAFTVNSYVTEIVVESGASYLKGSLSWASDSGTITLTSSTTTSGAVSGYIIVSRGGSITPTSTQVS